MPPGDAVIVATASNGVSGSASIHVTGTPSTSTDFHFNEIHYDNVGTDAGEAIEIEGPAGADVTGFTIVLYNGNGGAAVQRHADPERHDCRRAAARAAC